jgi:hypothetical protein
MACCGQTRQQLPQRAQRAMLCSSFRFVPESRTSMALAGQFCKQARQPLHLSFT